MNRPVLKAGELVSIRNTTPAGKEFTEGKARLVKFVGPDVADANNRFERWVVRFPCGDEVERNVFVSKYKAKTRGQGNG